MILGGKGLNNKSIDQTIKSVSQSINQRSVSGAMYAFLSSCFTNGNLIVHSLSFDNLKFFFSCSCRVHEKKKTKY